MIKSFKHKGLEQFFTKDIRRLLDIKDLSRITRILDRLDAAVLVNDMNIPGWDLHELEGDRKGIWSQGCPIKSDVYLGTDVKSLH